jgi:hypothetical protein
MKCDRTATYKICFTADWREPLYLCVDHLKKIKRKEPDGMVMESSFRHQCQVEEYKPLEVKDEIQEL